MILIHKYRLRLLFLLVGYFLLLGSLFSQQRSVNQLVIISDSSEVVMRYFEKGEDTPFTGEMIDYFFNGGVKRRVEIKNGLLDGDYREFDASEEIIYHVIYIQDVLDSVLIDNRDKIEPEDPSAIDYKKMMELNNLQRDVNVNVEIYDSILEVVIHNGGREVFYIDTLARCVKFIEGIQYVKFDCESGDGLMKFVYPIYPSEEFILYYTRDETIRNLNLLMEIIPFRSRNPRPHKGRLQYSKSAYSESVVKLRYFFELSPSTLPNDK